MSLLLGLLGGPAGRLLAGFAAAISILMAVALWLHEHDARLLAQQAARAATVRAAQQVADARAAAAAMQDVADAAQHREVKLAEARTEIAHATAPSCAVPAAVLRAVDALRTGP